MNELEEKVVWEYEYKWIEWYSRRAIVYTNTENRITTRTFAGLDVTAVKTAINWEVSVTVRGKGFNFGIRY